MPKLQKEQVKKRQTLLRRSIIILSVFGYLLSSDLCLAGLAGFTRANPYTQEEINASHSGFPESIKNYRDLMRQNVIMLSRYAKSQNPEFVVMAHEGQKLLDNGIWEFHLNDYNKSRQEGYSSKRDTLLLNPVEIQNQKIESLMPQYRQSIDVEVINNLFCQKDTTFNVPEGKILMTIDQCNASQLDMAIKVSARHHIPTYIFSNPQFAFKDAKNQLLIAENATNIEKIQQAQNILFLLDTSKFDDKENYLKEIESSNFDVIVISPFFNGKALKKEDVERLKYKKNGALRKIIAAMNISETDSDKYYWQSGWKIGNPSWLKRASFVDKKGIIVEYWSEEWQKIISDYFKGIVMQGFDGAFLTGLDNYQYFEDLTPLD